MPVCCDLFLLLLLLVGCWRAEGESSSQEVSIYNVRHAVWPPQKLYLRSSPCSCENFVCGCCAGISMQTINFNRKACMNLTYDPYEFSLTANMYMNEVKVFERSISGKNPPPICLPVPIPYVPNIHVCTVFFNVFTPGRNIHLCLDFELYPQRDKPVIIHFDCLRMGADGVIFLKPEDNGGLLSTPTVQVQVQQQSTSTEAEDEVYDEVAPGKDLSNTTVLF